MKKLKAYIYTYLNIILIHNDHRTNKDHHMTDQHVEYDSSKRVVRHKLSHIFGLLPSVIKICPKLSYFLIKYRFFSRVTVTVMLVTSLCWWLYDGDWFHMLVTESLCWRLFSLCWWFSHCIKSVANILNRSPTSKTCYQLIWSQTSATNIDVTSD